MYHAHGTRSTLISRANIFCQTDFVRVVKLPSKTQKFVINFVEKPSRKKERKRKTKRKEKNAEEKHRRGKYRANIIYAFCEREGRR